MARLKESNCTTLRVKFVNLFIYVFILFILKYTTEGREGT